MYHEYPSEHAWLAIAPVLGLTTAVLVHLLFAWLSGGVRAYRCVLRGFMGGELATLGISLYGLLSSQDLPLAFVLTYLVFNLVIFTALGFCYINFVGLSIASLRIRILQELLAHPEGLTLEKILESYNPKVLIDNRIGRLTSGGQLVDKDGRFQTGRRDILRAARIMRLVRFIILGRRPG